MITSFLHVYFFRPLQLVHFFLALLSFLPVTVNADPMRFTSERNGGNCSFCGWIAADGEITSNTPARFLEFMEQNKFGGRVVFNSPGGNLAAGIELGRIIREMELSTHVGKTVRRENDTELADIESGSCASACVFAFMGGIERQSADTNFIAQEGGLLGVHQFYDPNNPVALSSETQQILGALLTHTIEMGIDPKVIALASLVGPDEIYWLSDKEKIDFGLDNSSHYFEGWTVEPYNGGMVLTGKYHFSQNNWRQNTLFCRSGQEGWRLLISQSTMENSFDAVQYFLTTGVSSPWEMELAIGGVDFDLTSAEVEFASVDRDMAYLSIPIGLPGEKIEGKDFRFNPWLARAFGGIFITEGAFPSLDYLSLLEKNCLP